MKTLRRGKAWSLGTVPEEFCAVNKTKELLQELISDSSMKKDINAANECTDDSSMMDNSFITWVLLPCLLFIQFGMPFYIHDKATASLSWSLVNFVIVLYVAAVWIYRQACLDSNIGSVIMLLLPELLMDIVLALILFNRVVLALAALLASTMLLSTFVIVTMIRYLSSPGTRYHQMGRCDNILLDI